MAIKGWLNLNGSLIEEKTPVIRADNRAFRYGDGLFETMKVVVGSIRLKDLHFERLFTGMDTLQITLQGFVTAEMFEEQIMKTILKNRISGPARVRLTVFRGDGGLYEFNTTSSGYVIQVWSLSSSSMMMNDNGLKVGLYEGGRKAIDELSNIKSNNYLVYVMGAVRAKKYQHDDSIILNTNGRVCDSTIANVFYIKDGTIFTPPLTEGCVAGIMRNHLLLQLPQQGYSVVEKETSVDDLLDADEMFLTNAVSGLRWVGEFKSKKYGNSIASKIYHSTM
ncbi:MAG TPA: aminotransferase class IV [Flavitalea sp.]|nr:aminotransferase class IV [Flavitalea sp.]